MAGYWLNADTGTLVKVETTHDEWVRVRTNAKALGLSEDLYEAIMRYPPTAIDKIRLLALRGGLVRIREHPKYVSVQFWAEPARLNLVLQAVLVALRAVRLSPESTIKIDNLLTGDTTTVGINELADKLNRGHPLFEQERKTQ